MHNNNNNIGCLHFSLSLLTAEKRVRRAHTIPVKTTQYTSLCNTAGGEAPFIRERQKQIQFQNIFFFFFFLILFCPAVSVGRASLRGRKNVCPPSGDGSLSLIHTHSPGPALFPAPFCCMCECIRMRIFRVLGKSWETSLTSSGVCVCVYIHTHTHIRTVLRWCRLFY
jgi:hypothetical protein